MIEHLDISSQHFVIDDKLHKYVLKKIGHLDRYIPRPLRASAHAEVRLKQAKAADGKQFSCDVTLYLPGEPIHVAEPATNAFSAVDIAEAKLKYRITQYKERQGTKRFKKPILDETQE